MRGHFNRQISITNREYQRGLVGPIISRFEKRGFKLVAMKLTTPSQEHLEKHYADLATKPFFKGLVACKNAKLSEFYHYMGFMLTSYQTC